MLKSSTSFSQTGLNRDRTGTNLSWSCWHKNRQNINKKLLKHFVGPFFCMQISWKKNHSISLPTLWRNNTNKILRNARLCLRQCKIVLLQKVVCLKPSLFNLFQKVKYIYFVKQSLDCPKNHGLKFIKAIIPYWNFFWITKPSLLHQKNHL